MELTPQIGNDLQKACDEKIAEIYQRLYTNEPNYGVSLDCFKTSVNSTLCRFIAASDARPSDREILTFLDQLQSEDLYLALACAAGNERAWWDFDREHRSFMQRVARQLARTEVDAEEIIGVVYEQLYGTRIVDGQRQSKFSSYSGRGNLRGWLRTVIWHSLVDRHRAGHDE
ncbi:MAG TPA: hypothetical protein VNK26_07130, partial [Pyrinomonadaceae bacterium]|nr:hypothetical protein [Pyrinomonadaceae bacterium]